VGSTAPAASSVADVAVKSKRTLKKKKKIERRTRFLLSAYTIIYRHYSNLKT
jgi:hypothetical protein